MSKRKLLKVVLITPVAVGVLLIAACMAMLGAKPKPPASEFGYGPRTTVNRGFAVTIEETAPFKRGKMLSTVIKLQTANGAPVDGARITVDGGMPQHGHGLPTKPRVTRGLGDGRYQVDGLKFNMGGWWELKFAINATAGSDSVTFNLAL